jgi:hypothetical protein
MDALSDTQGLWAVTVSNGSGTQVLEVAGTQRTVWTWAAEAGRRGGIGVGGELWTPTGIELIRPIEDVGVEPFAAVVPVDEGRA